MAKNGVYVKPAPIGSGVITTDHVIAQGYDFVYLKMGGMLKVKEAQVDGDLTVGSGTAYAPPAALSFSTNLPATKSVATGAALALTVVAAGGVEPFTYVWTKGGVVIPGATTATYNKAAAAAGDAGVYVVTVKDAMGKTKASVACTVTVTA